MVALRVAYHPLILFPRHKLHILELIIFCTVPVLASPNGASLSEMLSKLKVKKTKRSLKSKSRLGKVAWLCRFPAFSYLRCCRSFSGPISRGFPSLPGSGKYLSIKVRDASSCFRKEMVGVTQGYWFSSLVLPRFHYTRFSKARPFQ